VRHAYSKQAEVTVPSPDDWEKQWKKKPHGMEKAKVVLVDFQLQQSGEAGTSGEVPAAAVARAG